jgi:hypothetical protein
VRVYKESSDDSQRMAQYIVHLYAAIVNIITNAFLSPPFFEAHPALVHTDPTVLLFLDEKAYHLVRHPGRAADIHERLVTVGVWTYGLSDVARLDPSLLYLEACPFYGCFPVVVVVIVGGGGGEVESYVRGREVSEGLEPVEAVELLAFAREEKCDSRWRGSLWCDDLRRSWTWVERPQDG